MFLGSQSKVTWPHHLFFLYINFFTSFWVWVFYLYVCTLCVVYWCVPGTHGCQKRAFGSLELKVQMVVCYPVWMLRIKARSSSSRAVSALNCWAVLGPFCDEAVCMTGSVCLMAREQEKESNKAQGPIDAFKDTLQEDAKVLLPRNYTDLGTKPLTDNP